jgi:hypothetical protein
VNTNREWTGGFTHPRLSAQISVGPAAPAGDMATATPALGTALTFTFHTVDAEVAALLKQVGPLLAASAPILIAALLGG